MLSVSEVKKLLKQGFTDAEIAQQLGYSRYQVITFRQANNIPSSHKWKKDKKTREIHKLRNKCRNQKELGEKVGLSQNRVSELIKENEIDYKKKKDRLRIRKFGTWTIKKRLDGDMYECLCDCGYTKTFSATEIKYNSCRCPECKMKHSFRIRQKMFLADYKRAEKNKQKDLKKRGKTYIINNVKKIDDIGRNVYVNLVCPQGHMTKNKFDRYDGCRICE